METIVESILKIIPIDEWLAAHAGLSKEASAGLAFLILFGVVYGFYHFGKKYFEEQTLLNKLKDLKPQWDYLAVKQAQRYYIPTQYQNASPARQEEPGFTHQYVARNPLIPFFIEKAFNEKADSVLAGRLTAPIPPLTPATLARASARCSSLTHMVW